MVDLSDIPFVPDNTEAPDLPDVPDAPSWSDIAPKWLRNNSDTLKNFLQNPEGFVLGIIFSAIIGGILDIGRSVIDAVRYVWWGSASTYGIADLPRLLVQPIIDAVATIAGAVITELESILTAQLQAMPDLWLLGPVVTYAFVTVQLLAVGWIVWQVIRAINVPGINLGPLISALTAPFRLILRVIR